MPKYFVTKSDATETEVLEHSTAIYNTVASDCLNVEYQMQPLVMDTIFPFKSSFVIICVTQSFRENHPTNLHYPIFQCIIYFLVISRWITPSEYSNHLSNHVSLVSERLFAPKAVRIFWDGANWVKFTALRYECDMNSNYLHQLSMLPLNIKLPIIQSIITTLMSTLNIITVKEWQQANQGKHDS